MQVRESWRQIRPGSRLGFLCTGGRQWPCRDPVPHEPPPAWGHPPASCPTAPGDVLPSPGPLAKAAAVPAVLCVKPGHCCRAASRSSARSRGRQPGQREADPPQRSPHPRRDGSGANLLLPSRASAVMEKNPRAGACLWPGSGRSVATSRCHRGGLAGSLGGPRSLRRAAATSCGRSGLGTHAPGAVLCSLCCLPQLRDPGGTVGLGKSAGVESWPTSCGAASMGWERHRGPSCYCLAPAARGNLGLLHRGRCQGCSWEVPRPSGLSVAFTLRCRGMV